ncbi:MAG: HNH endonuclease [Schlesneria sp.]
MIFDYPVQRSERRHGPSGYVSYESYRPWLRDEFDFRCVYCLKREVWGQVTGEFELDHFEPQSANPHLQLDYFNLVYACRRCNSVKSSQVVDDPFHLLCSENIETLRDGSLLTDDIGVMRLIRQLDLNSPRMKSWRILWMRIVELTAEYDEFTYTQLVSVSAEFPDLSQLRTPSNSRIQGIEESWFARQRRGESLQMR